MQKNSSQELLSSVAKLELEENGISPEVAVSNSLKDYENKKVVFSFVTYDNSQCRIAKIDKVEAKKLTKELKKISETQAKHFRHQNASSIACKPVRNSGAYAVLFKEVPEDVDLLEVDYSGPGRIFGYMVENIFNIVSIAKEHK